MHWWQFGSRYALGSKSVCVDLFKLRRALDMLVVGCIEPNLGFALRGEYRQAGQHHGKISRFQDFKISRFSRFQDFKISRFLRFQDFKISRSSRFQDFKISYRIQ